LGHSKDVKLKKNKVLGKSKFSKNLKNSTVRKPRKNIKKKYPVEDGTPDVGIKKKRKRKMIGRMERLIQLSNETNSKKSKNVVKSPIDFNTSSQNLLVSKNTPPALPQENPENYKKWKFLTEEIKDPNTLSTYPSLIL
jgi:hypothetical protein